MRANNGVSQVPQVRQCSNNKHLLSIRHNRHLPNQSIAHDRRQYATCTWTPGPCPTGLQLKPHRSHGIPQCCRNEYFNRIHTVDKHCFDICLRSRHVQGWQLNAIQPSAERVYDEVEVDDGAVCTDCTSCRRSRKRPNERGIIVSSS